MNADFELILIYLHCIFSCSPG